MVLLIHPSLKSILPTCKLKQLVSKLRSHQEELYNLEKRSRDGGLQAWEDYRELGDWNTSHSTLNESRKRRPKFFFEEKEINFYCEEWHTIQRYRHYQAIC